MVYRHRNTRHDARRVPDADEPTWRAQTREPLTPEQLAAERAATDAWLAELDAERAQEAARAETRRRVTRGLQARDQRIGLPRRPALNRAALEAHRDPAKFAALITHDFDLDAFAEAAAAARQARQYRRVAQLATLGAVVTITVAAGIAIARRRK